MEENKNINLDDEAMSEASGGAGENIPAPIFNVGNKVIYVTDNSELVIESRKYAGEPHNYWLYVARDPNHKNRFVSGADHLFRLA